MQMIMTGAFVFQRSPTRPALFGVRNFMREKIIFTATMTGAISRYAQGLRLPFRQGRLKVVGRYRAFDNICVILVRVNVEMASETKPKYGLSERCHRFLCTPFCITMLNPQGDAQLLGGV